MTPREFCTIDNIQKYIKQNKKQGIKNCKIIKQLIKQGCCFTIVFDAMDEYTKKNKV